jgi:septal ring factor EnvC (AmiA/AmiB activator)
MTTLYNEDGSPVEALTEEEIKAKIEEAKTQTQEELETTKTTLEETKTALAQKTADLDKLNKDGGNKDKNWKEIRDAKEAREKEVAELTKKVTDLEGKITGVTTATEEAKIDNAIKAIAGADPEMAKKIKFHFNSFSGKPENDEKFAERLNSAYILATGGKAIGKPTGGSFSSGGGGAPAYDRPATTGKKLDNPESMDVGKKLGISEEDAKKAGLV